VRSFVPLALWVLVSLPARAAALDTVAVRAAHHSGSWTGETIEWESTFVLADLVRPGYRRVTFAVPLPASVTVVGGRPFVPSEVRDPSGALVGLDLEGTGHRHVVRLTQPIDATTHRLAAPLSSGDAVQRLTLEGAAFDPQASLGLQQHLSGLRQAGIDRDERRACDDALDGRRPHARQHPIYVTADARTVAAGGLIGELRPSNARSGTVAIGVAAVFALTTALMVGMVRALGRMARVERDDAYIRREFED
jgi:hypothetical protein